MGKTPITHTFQMPDGKSITLETGKLATQSEGSVVVRMGDCMVFASVVSSRELKEGQNFFPLSVDYQEKFASAGRIPGGFFKRETRPSDYEILICRIVDRALRPLFPEDYMYDTQVIINMISADKNVQPDCLAALAASTALALSDIPFNGPISEVRVGRINGELIVNPARPDIATGDLDIIVAATETSIVMVEGEAKECSEHDLVQAIKLGHEAVNVQIKAIHELVAKAGGKKATRDYLKPEGNEELKAKITETFSARIAAIAGAGKTKAERKTDFTVLKEELKLIIAEMEEDQQKLAKKYYSDLEYDVVRQVLLDTGKRLDGRGEKDIRPIWIETDYLPSPHGSAIFTRGETQSLTTVTLGTKDDEQMLDKAMELSFQKFMLHYNFPPYSTGEVKMMRGQSRREVGHGNLAWRSVKNQLPPESECPYTIRVVSDILESNGSSSMATVCAASLALHDAGIKMKQHVSGIAMGMISKDNKVAILSDILGDEDHLGDMDFKVTGTRNGICGCQMDIKIEGLSYELLERALLQAREGRLHILNLMYEAQPAPREDYKPHAPRIVTLYIPQDFIGAVIGPGGKIIQGLQRETNTVISIEEVDNQGVVTVASPDAAGLQMAVDRIKGITTMPETGLTYEGKITSIMPYGAFVEFLPGREGLLHISEVSYKRLENLDGVLAQGDMVKVKLLDIDQKSGKFKLSRRALMEKPEGWVEREPRSDDRRGGDRRSGGRDRDRGPRRDDRDRGPRREHHRDEPKPNHGGSDAPQNGSEQAGE